MKSSLAVNAARSASEHAYSPECERSLSFNVRQKKDGKRSYVAAAAGKQQSFDRKNAIYISEWARSLLKTQAIHGADTSK